MARSRLRMMTLGLALGAMTGCAAQGGGSAGAVCAANRMLLIINSAGSGHRFCVETARTESEQQRGLMYRTDLTPEGGMLFAPYPPNGGPPQEASFWMANTPMALDIIFIRPDGTIARIADNTIPFSETPIPSGEPVSAVLELTGGRSAALGIHEGDRVSWTAADAPRG